MAFELRDYQIDATRAANNWIKNSIDPCVVGAPTGSGKSLMACEIAMQYLKMCKDTRKVLMLAPTATLVDQNYKTFLSYTGKPASRFSASAGEKCLKHSVVIGTPQSVKNQVARLNNFGLVIADECFTGNTIIDTPNGYVKIKDVKIGDIVYNAIGCGFVLNAFNKTSNTIIIRTKNGKEIECTREHPVFTKKGFIKAEELENGTRIFSREELQMLWGSFSSKIHSFRKRINCCKCIGITLGEAKFLFKLLCSETEQPDAYSKKYRKNERYIKENESYAYDARRKWKSSKFTTAGNLVRIRGRMGDGIFSFYKKRTFKWNISKLLQNRYCKQKPYDCNRSGRVIASYANWKRKGFEKNGTFKRTRMESISSIKCGSVKTVYNLHVSGHPSYYAHGILVHNCHETTPSIKKIIEHLKAKNDKLRIVGLSGTPFRLGEGYIYKHHYELGALSDELCSEKSYYHSLVYDIPTRLLINQGYLTKPVFDPHEIHYDTSKLTINRMGKFDESAITQTFVGQGRLTADIVADVVEKTKFRNCVLWFAATIQHAHEIAQSLPSNNTRVVTGETKSKELEKILTDFKNGNIRHLINVAMLHRGFDAPNIDSIAILRATESATLYLQIIGRGLRLHDSKTECLILDYAENIERLAPAGDIFEPEIKSKFKAATGEALRVKCPVCECDNHFGARPNPDGYAYTEDGYFADLRGIKITNTDGVPISSHYGRRCLNEHLVAGSHKQCNYRWSSKQCLECEHHNDITARYCEKCKGELIDPNEKLAIEAAKIASDPYRVQIKPVLNMALRQWPGKDGKSDTLRVDYSIEDKPHLLSEWYAPDASNAWAYNRWKAFSDKALESHELMKDVEQIIELRDYFKTPKEIAFKKKQGSQFYEVVAIEW